MKKVIFIVAILAVFSSCKQKEADIEDTSKYETYTGNFLLTDQGAVLENGNRVYGVVVDAMAKDLDKQVDKVKNDDFDMVQVTVKGEVGQNPTGEEGWEQYITIKEIMSVADKPSAADIKLEAPKKEQNVTN